MRFGRTVLIAAIAAAPVAAFAQAAGPRDYIAQAGASDMYEKQSSQLLLTSTHNPELRRFANQMIVDHTKSTNMVKRAATRSHITPPPPHLMPKQASMLAELRAAHGVDRDHLYVRQQKMAHDEALALHSSFAHTGSPAPLRETAAQIAPVVQSHIAMLRHM
jgi:putative membrane protein